MAKTIINKSITFLFQWKGENHKIHLKEKNFNYQGDRFYAYFYIGKDYFYFEDDEEDKDQAALNMPGVWFQPELDEDGNETAEEEYFWDQSVLQVLRVDGKPVHLNRNGRA